MEISSPRQPTSPLMTVSRQTGAEELASLKPGTQLSAEVLSCSVNGVVSLKLSGRILKVVSELPLVAGSRIELQVEQHGDETVLRLLNPKPTTAQQIQQALRQLLPRQQPLQPLFTQLAKLALGDPGADRATTPLAPLPTDTIRALGKLLQQLPGHHQVATARGLQQAMQNSGLFFEQHLQQPGQHTELSADLRSILLRIGALLRQTLAQRPAPQQQTNSGTNPAGQPHHHPTAQTGDTLESGIHLLQQLRQQCDAGVARLQFHQLLALNAQQQGDETALTLELPLYTGSECDTLELVVQKEPSHSEEETAPRWSVTLKLDSASHGTVRAVVSLRAGEVSTTFWCAEAHTQQLFAQHLETLHQQLQRQGLVVGKTQALHGTPPPAPVRRHGQHPHANLINTKA